MTTAVLVIKSPPIVTAPSTGAVNAVTVASDFKPSRTSPADAPEAISAEITVAEETV